jgi:hypothetical protein
VAFRESEGFLIVLGAAGSGVDSFVLTRDKDMRREMHADGSLEKGSNSQMICADRSGMIP